MIIVKGFHIGIYLHALPFIVKETLISSKYRPKKP